MSPVDHATLDVVRLMEIPRGAHVAWVVADDESFRAVSRSVIDGGVACGEKTFVFGPEGSGARRDLATGADVAADPRVAFLDGGPLEPERMFAAFRAAADAARAEGFVGIRVVADMDWLLPAEPSADQVVAFELLLDRVVRELGATVVCAYRATSFPADTVLGTLTVHPSVAGADVPLFRMVSTGRSGWHISGEVDHAVGRPFAAAIQAATESGPCELDVSGLGFIDVAGMRELAHACRGASAPVQFRGVSATFRRLWSVCGFDEIVRLDADTATGGEPSAN